MDKYLLGQRLNALLEANMDTLRRGTDSGRLSRGSKLAHYYKGLGKDRDGNAVLRWNVPSGTVRGKTHHCFIAILPANGKSLFALAKARKDLRSRMEAIRNADVKCFCTCKDFNYSGARYNLNHMGSLAKGFESEKGVPDGSGIPPTRKQGILLCKHLVASFNGIKTNCGTIMKDAATARFSTGPESAAMAEAATDDFFKAEKDVMKGGKMAKVAVDVAAEFVNEHPVKLEAAEESLNQLALATAKLDPDDTETGSDAGKAIGEVGLAPADNGETAGIPAETKETDAEILENLLATI